MSEIKNIEEGGGGPGEPGGESGYPEWFLMQERASGYIDRSDKLATGWEFPKCTELMIKLGEIEGLQLGDPKKEVAETGAGKELGKKEEAETKRREEFSRKKEEAETETRGELSRMFRMATGAALDRNLEITEMMDRLQEPFPYMSQPQMGYFSNAKNKLLGLARYYDAELPKSVEPWFRKIDGVLEQQKGMLNLLLSAGASTGAYFDAVGHLDYTLKNRNRYHATSRDMRACFSSEQPGVTISLTPDQKEFLKGTFAEKEPRKELERVLADTRLFIMATAAVAQTDIELPEGKEIFMNLSDKKVYFIKLLFGDTDESRWVTWTTKDFQGNDRSITMPRRIETWYASGDKLKIRESWLSKMMAVVEWKDEDTGLGLWDFLGKDDGVEDDVKKEQIRNLAINLNKKATEIKAGIEDKVAASRFERNAVKAAIAGWIEMDKPWMVSGRLAWNFIYLNLNETEHGLDKVIRKKEVGGIYKAYDVYNIMYPWEKYLGYKAGWKSTSQFFIASADSMRKEKFIHRPDWMPGIYEWLDKDPRMKQAWDLLFDPKHKRFRAERIAGDSATEDEIQKAMEVADLTPEIAKALKESAFAYVTAYKNADGENIAVPMFLPKELEYINLWKYMIVDTPDGKKSVWDLWCEEGTKTNKINWDSANYETLDRMWVSMNMLIRFSRLWIDPYEGEKDPFIHAFFENAGTQSVSELAKRIILAFRDLPVRKDIKIMMAKILPFSIAQYEAQRCGLTGTGLATSGEKAKILQKWNFNVSKWIRAFQWMPNTMYDTEIANMSESEIKSAEVFSNMGNDLAMITRHHKWAFERVAMAAFAADKEDLQKIYNDLLLLHNKDSAMKEVLKREGDEVIFGSFGDEKRQSFSDPSEEEFEERLFGRKR